MKTFTTALALVSMCAAAAIVPQMPQEAPRGVAPGRQAEVVIQPPSADQTRLAVRWIAGEPEAVCSHPLEVCGAVRSTETGLR